MKKKSKYVLLLVRICFFALFFLFNFLLGIEQKAYAVVYGPYTFNADGDADESAWTFISDFGSDGLRSANSARSWSHDTNDTASSGVGPTSGQGGSPDGYVYTEASSPAALNDTFHMTNNTILNAATDAWQISFYWNQRGNDNEATVKVQTNENGAGWVTRGTYGSGGPNVVSGGTQVWNYANLNLAGVISNASTQIRLLVTFPSSGTVWHNDFGLDTITITGTPLNSPPTATFNSAVQKTDASGKVDISIEVDDPNDNKTKAKLEYDTDASCNGPWLDPTLDQTGGASADFNDTSGSPSVVNADSYQVGTTSNRQIITTSGSNTINFDWSSLTDQASANGTYCLRLTVNDGTVDQSVLATTTFTLDNLAPSGLSALTAGATTAITQVLNWSAVTETNFNHYEIWYGTNQSDVQNRSGSALEWDNGDDANLSTISTATTTIAGLSADSTYYYKIWAIDNYGNSQTVVDINATTDGSSQIWPFDSAGDYTYNGADIEIADSYAQLIGVEDGWWNANYAYRKKITFGTAHSSLPLYYTSAILMDTRTSTTNIALTSGNDVRIVWQPEVGSDLELDRIASAWNNASSTIKFRLQSAIGANLAEDVDGSYYIYYGYAGASSPPANENNVFYFGDYFNRADSATVGNGWTEVESGGSVSISSNVLNEETNNIGPPDSGVRQYFPLGPLASDFTLEWDWTIPVNAEGIWTAYTQIGDSMDDAARESGVAFGLISGEGSHFVPNNLYNMNSGLSNNLETDINGTQSYKLAVNYAAKTFSYYRGGVLRSSGVPFLNAGTALSQIRLSNDQYSATESNLLWDNVKVYLNVSDAPEEALGTEVPYASFATSKPTVRPGTSSGVNFTSLYAFATTEQTNGGSIMYQITNDGGNASPTWYYWNGANWVAAVGATDYNSAATINSNITQFEIDVGTGNFSFRAFLISDGAQFVRLDAVNLSYMPETLTATINDLVLFYENQTPKVRIDYTLVDPEADSCNFITATDQLQYSAFEDGPWTDITIFGTTSGVDASPEGVSHNASFEPLYWDTSGIADGDYYIRMKPHDGVDFASYATSPVTVQIYTPSADDLLRNGKFFFSEVLNFFGW